MQKWLLALCPKYSHEIIEWFECEAYSIYHAMTLFEKRLGFSIGPKFWVDGTII
jgi:hypothetical protein